MTSNNSSGSNNGEVTNLRLDCSSAAGAPTLTTPTLTPTTLRNIEQMFLEASDGASLEQPVVHENAAHFVPPPIAMELPSSVDRNNPLPGPNITVKVPPPLPGPHLLVPDGLVNNPPPLPNVHSQIPSSTSSSQVPLIVKSEPDEYLMQQQSSSTTLLQPQLQPDESTSMKRNRNNNINVISENLELGHQEGNDEERKKQLRRLRNKEAAARCRKRRLDQTVSLQQEVDKLEDVKNGLRQELEALQGERDKLKGILDLHQCSFEANFAKKQPKMEHNS